MKNFGNILLIIFGIAMLGVFIAVIPGLLWFVFGLVVDLFNLIDKILTGFANFWWDLSWSIKIPICLILSICFFFIIWKRKNK